MGAHANLRIGKRIVTAHLERFGWVVADTGLALAPGDPEGLR